MLIKKTILLCAFLFPSLFAQKDSARYSPFPRIRVEGFGSFIYHNYSWQTFPGKRSIFDMPQVVIASEIIFNDRLSLEMEIEFEHGGTGVTMEFDKFEEFGEFEQEVEKGGEVLLEEVELAFQVNDHLEIEGGRIGVPLGFVTDYNKPNDYFTTTYNNVELTLLPTEWHEFGAGVEGSFGKDHAWEYRMAVVSGLDATGFSSANWVLPGYQLRFETVNAENLAVTTRLDYSWDSSNRVGFGAYYGNSSDNRPKADLLQDAHVGIYEAHVALEKFGFKSRGLLLYGTLENSDKVSEANRNLSNNLNVKRTPVGSAALGWYAELGYDVMRYFPQENQNLYVFGGYYYYDTMFKTKGIVFNNPRWERKELRGGVQWVANNNISLKSDFTRRVLGISKNRIENTFALAVGFQF